MSTPALVLNCPKPTHTAPISERIRVMWRNRGCWKIRIALGILRRAFRGDPGFRQAWHANIAMPIYDTLTKSCTCTRRSEMYHERDCPRNGVSPISIKQANQIADKLMKHLFNS